MLVVGDIGGTKTALAFHGLDDLPRVPRFQKEYRSAAYPNLETIVRAFLAEIGQRAAYASFAVAGPVLHGRASLTNLPWIMEEAELATSLGLKRVFLLNDLLAVATAIPGLGAADYETLHEGENEPRGPIAIVAPGTGLGEAFVIWAEGVAIACASEGGHASFAPTNEAEAALWRYLHDKLGAVSVERVCAGPGIAHIYDFLCARGDIPESPALGESLARAADRTPLIVQAGAAGEPLAQAAMDMFIGILGSEAGNLALKIMATGGVFLAGGISARVLPLLHGPRFRDAFTAKGRLAPVLQRMGLRVITAPANLVGAAQFGLNALRAPPALQ